MKQYLTKENGLRLAVTLCFLALFAWALIQANSGSGPEEPVTAWSEYETARVLEVLEDNSQPDEAIEGRLRGSMVLKLEILSGTYKGRVVETVKASTFGRVQIDGDIWKAVTNEANDIAEGTTVCVVSRESTIITVETIK